MTNEGGMPKFVPDQQQRTFVGRMAGLLTWAEMAGLVINPRSSKPISKKTLQRAFANELRTIQRFQFSRFRRLN